MHIITFMRSTAGRVTRAVLGLALILFGALSGTLFGLVLMMIGIVPAVTGIAGVCLYDEIIKLRSQHNASQGPHARHA